VILAIIENFIWKIKGKAHQKNEHENKDKDTDIQEQQVEEPKG
jgi:hypothetical protein